MSASVPSPKLYHVTLSPAHISSPGRFPYMRPFTAEMKSVSSISINQIMFRLNTDSEVKLHTDYHASYCSPRSPRFLVLSLCCQTSRYSCPNTSSCVHPWQKIGERTPYPHLSVKQCTHSNSKDMKGLQMADYRTCYTIFNLQFAICNGPIPQ